MKLYLISLILLISNSTLDAQNLKGSIGINFSSFGENDVFRSEELIGGPSYMGKDYFAIGVNYLYPIKKWLDFGSGLEFAQHKIEITAGPSGETQINSRTEKFSLVNVPLTLRLNFLRYFFVNAGFNLTIDGNPSSPIDSQSGIGFNSGLGIKYDFDFGGSVFINPYYKNYSIVPFSHEDYHQKVLETGVRFGIMYKLGGK
jgi:hypothetical protein